MRILRLTTLLSLIAFGPLARSAHATTAEDINAFHRSDDYTYCEVRFLAARWQIDEYDTKARIGNHLRTGRTQALETEVQAARQAAMGSGSSCNFYETGFTLTDAERLASFWGMDLYDTKVMIEQKATRGNYEGIRWALSQAPAASATPSPGYVTSPETDALNALWNSDLFCQCDATLLAAFWGIDYYDSKVRLGTKIAGGQTRAASDAVKRARDQARVSGTTCHFYETPFDLDDAAALSRLWGQPMEDTKARIVRRYIAGEADAIRRDLKRSAKSAPATP